MENLNTLALNALREFEQYEMVKLEYNDTVYVWVYVDENGNPAEVRVSDRNHSPEGVATEVQTLSSIESWWDNSWSYEK